MKKIGILGGGQLSQLLLKESMESGLNIRAYCQDKNDPAYNIGNLNSIGKLDDPMALQAFIDSVDICSFESEFVDCDKLSELSGAKEKFHPSLENMSRLQDRKSQKELLELYKLPNLPFFHCHYPEWMSRAAEELKNNVVFKARRNSYDGNGTYICKSAKDVESFVQHNKNVIGDFIMEPLFKFKRELAITAYRSSDGTRGVYPLVEWKARDSKCHWVMGPVKSKLLSKLEKRILNFLDRIDYVGVMAFEIFDSSKGFFINELAPRVHNSTHYSLDAMGLNQFLVHAKCLLGDKLPRRLSSHSGGFAMVNLIGSGASSTSLNTHNDSKLYWYAKNQNREGRKLGHINAVSKSPKMALKNALKGASLCQV